MTMQQPEKPHSEYLNDIQEMCDNVKLIKAGKLKERPVESLLDELNIVTYIHGLIKNLRGLQRNTSRLRMIL